MKYQLNMLKKTKITVFNMLTKRFMQMIRKSNITNKKILSA